MRLAVAVTAAAVADLAIFLRIGDWIGASAVLAIAYLLFAALGAGFFAGRRAPLAGGLSVLVGALLYGVVSYASTGAGADLWTLAGYEVTLVLSVLPYIAIGAIAGGIGGRLRRSVLARA